jgi:dCTP deaminase
MTHKLGPSDTGVLASQHLETAIKNGWIASTLGDVPLENIQPSSLDLRLGDVAYRLRCSFLPDGVPVEEKLKLYQMGEVSLAGEGGILEQNRPYLVPLVERIDLPTHVRARTNPKSSTGRLDIFTRVITDHSYMFDEIPAGYRGQLYLEVVPRTFTIRLKSGLSLNQLRLAIGKCSLDDQDIIDLHRTEPLLYNAGKALGQDDIAVSNGLFVGLDLGRPKGNVHVGYRGKENSNLIDLSKIAYYSPSAFWEDVISEPGGRIVLHPEKFYLLLSKDSVRIPPGYAAEMTAYDPTSGELRTHYAGFFDPGFGHEPTDDGVRGSKAALEVRAHDVPFAVEDGQNICRLSFERLIEPSDRLYGHAAGSNYQDQEIALSKHFKRGTRRKQEQADLF